ncbi:MAG TPA: alpha-L-arabinofuranosidase C-terminal domain-containing protein [Spirochaetia bacterium]|nr:alpha-L-arabinofuranosidase C-terminal domain-containing protein [Spirochaetia bacterium]
MKATMTIVLDEKIGTVNPNIFGHFAEHLGRCIYEGIWVGEDSSIPNVRGIRTDVVNALRRLAPPVLRWPGGCFADDYHWRDGIGPRESRPRRFNIHWGNALEPNSFGTHEFIDLCRQIGAEPYISLNIGSGSPQEAQDWLEYCNGTGDSALTEERRRNGAAEPFNVRYWGIGNELWGCGGHWQPDAYAAEVKRYVTFMNHFGVFKIACGPRGTNPFEMRRDWTADFFREYAKVQHPSKRPIEGFSLHFYTRDTDLGGDLVFSPAQYYAAIRDTMRISGLIREVRAGIEVYDPQRSIGLVIDEWGTWYPEARSDTGLEQQNTMRDALVAALNLDIFVRNADVVAMANIAQTINVLQAMILTRGERMVLTPSYHVFEMYRHHQAGESVRVLTESPAAPDGAAGSGPAGNLSLVAGSASLKEKRLFLTLTNSHIDESVDVEVVILGAGHPSVHSVKGRQLAGSDVHDHNSFEHSDGVRPTELLPSWKGGDRTTLRLPAHSVSALELELA